VRKYVRHPAEIPVEYYFSGEINKQIENSKNIAFGGMCFTASEFEEKGKILNIKIPSIDPEFEIRGKVAWCLQNRDSVQIGVQFIDLEDTFKARLVEQVCQIKHYKKKILQVEGRRLTDHEAALEWIDKFASDF